MTVMLRYGLIALLLSAGVFAERVQAQHDNRRAPDQDDKSIVEQLQNVAKQARANQQAFDSFVSEFELDFGTVESLETLDKGALTDPVTMGRGFLARYGDNEVYRISPTDHFKVTPLKINGQTVGSAPFTPQVSVASNTHSFILTTVLGSGVVSKRDRSKQAFSIYSPWHTLGLIGAGSENNPVVYLQQCLVHGTFSNIQHQDGIVIASGRYGQFQQQIRLDAQRGHLPVAFSLRSPEAFAEFRVIATIDAPDIGSFPSTIIGTSADKLPAPGHRLRVTHLELRDPTIDELSYQPENRISISADSPATLKPTRLNWNDAITPDTLPDLYSAAAARQLPPGQP